MYQSYGIRGQDTNFIGYKYNAQKVLYFIVIDNTWSTQAGLLYLSKYHDQFYSVSICPVAHPLVMYTLFRSVNEVDSQNKSRKSDLMLYKFCVTQCVWL